MELAAFNNDKFGYYYNAMYSWKKYAV